MAAHSPSLGDIPSILTRFSKNKATFRAGRIKEVAAATLQQQAMIQSRDDIAERYAAQPSLEVSLLYGPSYLLFFGIQQLVQNPHENLTYDATWQRLNGKKTEAWSDYYQFVTLRIDAVATELNKACPCLGTAFAAYHHMKNYASSLCGSRQQRHGYQNARHLDAENKKFNHLTTQ